MRTLLTCVFVAVLGLVAVGCTTVPPAIDYCSPPFSPLPNGQPHPLC